MATGHALPGAAAAGQGAGYDIGAVRKDFPALSRTVRGGLPLVYLDNAATSHKPWPVLDAERDFYAYHNANVHRGVHALALVQAELARIKDGARAAVIASSPRRLALIESKGARAVDRSAFADLAFDADRFAGDAAYRGEYRAAERRFPAEVADFTGGRGASIVIDNIGGRVYRASLRALAREGVIATCGWKHGMTMEYYRAIECIGRHQHIHTHACGRHEVPEAVAFQEEHGWLPEVSEVTPWEDIGWLSQAYADGKLDDYFPVFQVNPV